MCRSSRYFFFFFFNDTATTEIYTLSLHDALPISAKSGPEVAFASLCSCRGLLDFALARLPARHRQAQQHESSPTQRRADAHRAAMQLGERPGDGEPEPRALVALGEPTLDLFERASKLGERVVRDADAGVGDGDAHPFRGPSCTDGDAAALGRELDRVGEKIEHDLLEQAVVGRGADAGAGVGGGGRGFVG